MKIIYKLEDISVEKIVKIVSIKEENNGPNINVYINDKNICFLNLKNDQKLDEVRSLICDKIEKKDLNFIFLDSDSNEIEENDEKDYSVEDILINGSIQLKSKSNNLDSTPSASIDKNNLPPKDKENKGIIKNLKICLKDGGNLCSVVKDASPKDTLKDIRNKIKNITEKYLFYDGDDIIELSAEDFFEIETIILDDKIYIKYLEDKTKQQSNPNKKEPQIKNIPINGSKLIEKIGNLEIYLYPSSKYTPQEEANSKSMMVVGQTGCGKTTLLNSLVNYLTGINFDDNFRYKIIDEGPNVNHANSVTSEVNIYYIHSHNGHPPIKIIDTPGFGDTRGIEMDKQITKKIEKKFQTEINQINAICFVAQSSNARLTANQKYIFSSIMDLFGNDVAENFVAMLTFCDGEIPQIINALQEKDSIFDKVIPKIKEPWYLKFNNSAIFSVSKDKFNAMFWELGMESFKNFVMKLNNLSTKSLTLSKAVLSERNNLNLSVENLQIQLQNGLNKMSSIRDLFDQIDSAQKIINGSKNFETITENDKVVKENLPSGTYTTLCVVCNFTCHQICGIPDDRDKRGCWAISGDYCTQCPSKCHWTNHHNAPYIIKTVKVKQKVTLEDLKKKYDDGNKNLSLSQRLMNGMIKEGKEILSKCMNIQENIKDIVNKLARIALNPNTLNSEEYIELLIRSEKQEQKTGWQKRVDGLEAMKKQQKLIRQAFKGEMKNDEFEKFKNELIEKQSQEAYQSVIKNSDVNKNSCNIY